MRIILFLAAALLAIVEVWSLLWIFSSSSLAFVACEGSFSLEAANPRCRQPSIAVLLFSGSLVLSAAAVVLGARSKR